MSTTSRDVVNYVQTDGNSLSSRSLYFCMKKAVDVLSSGTASAAEKEVAKSILDLSPYTPFSGGYLSHAITCISPTIEAAVAANSVSTVTDEDISAAVDTLFANYVAGLPA